MTVPELRSPPDIYYDKEAYKYHRNSRINKIQREITRRAIGLLEIESSSIILDIGCGSGLSGFAIEECGCLWIGIDISVSMLEIAKDEGNPLSVVYGDIGKKSIFRDQSIEYFVSISAVQWLFQSYKSSEVPSKRIKLFFHELFRIITVRGVMQVYCTSKELQILRKEASIAGFATRIVVDNENTKNRKTFLIIEKKSPRKINKIPKRNIKTKGPRAILE